MKKIISLVILLIIIGVGYFLFVKKSTIDDQQVNPIPQNTILPDTRTNQTPNTTTLEPSFKL